MTLSFQKKKENFICEHCFSSVIGNGYTNHCPACLWSKHVDINPGDRRSECGAMMEPLKVESASGRSKSEWIITHKCTKCKYEKRNKIAKEDNLELLQQVAKDFASL